MIIDSERRIAFTVASNPPKNDFRNLRRNIFFCKKEKKRLLKHCSFCSQEDLTYLWVYLTSNLFFLTILIQWYFVDFNFVESFSWFGFLLNNYLFAYGNAPRFHRFETKMEDGLYSKQLLSRLCQIMKNSKENKAVVLENKVIPGHNQS